MPKTLVCWKCGASLEKIETPFTRHEECPQCSADLHVCVMCRHYKPSLIRKCDHPTAEPVREKERANFCSKFKPRVDAYSGGYDVRTRQAQAELDALFGGGSEDGTSPGEADEVRAKLEELFGTKTEKE